MTNDDQSAADREAVQRGIAFAFERGHWTEPYALADAAISALRARGWRGPQDPMVGDRDALANAYGRISCVVHAIDGKGDNTPADDVIARINVVREAIGRVTGQCEPAFDDIPWQEHVVRYIKSLAEYRADADAEIARLRAALEKIASPIDTGEGLETDNSVCAQWAREALNAGAGP